MEADQDERFLWSNRTTFTVGAQQDVPIGPSQFTAIDLAPPMAGYIDITQRRRMRNEENAFWLWRLRSYIYTSNVSDTSSDPEYEIGHCYSIKWHYRTLWAFD